MVNWRIHQLTNSPVHQFYAFGPEATTAGLTPDANAPKFSRNIRASLAACASYSAPFAHVFRGFSTAAGTSGQLVGMSRLKTGSRSYATVSSRPASAARIIALV